MKNLDLRTKIFLYITGAVIETQKEYTMQRVNPNVVYIFSNYDEYKSYFEKYIDDVKPDIIDLAIYTKSKNGGIIALKGLCDRIITKSTFKIDNLYLTSEQINDIHERGKITPLEKVKEWEKFDICAPGDAIGSAKDRCYYFQNDCHQCLLHYASQKAEYDKTEFEVVNSFSKKKQFDIKK